MSVASVVVALIQSVSTPSADLGPLWETAKGVMLSLTTLGVGAVVKMQFKTQGDVREIKQELFGLDGKNGLKSVITRSNERLDAIDARHIALDAVAAAERDLYDGEEKRHSARRMSDQFRERHE